MEFVGALYLLVLLVLVGYRVSLMVRVIRAERAGDTERANELRMLSAKLRIAWATVFVVLAAVIVIATVA